MPLRPDKERIPKIADQGIPRPGNSAMFAAVVLSCGSRPTGSTATLVRPAGHCGGGHEAIGTPETVCRKDLRRAERAERKRRDPGLMCPLGALGRERDLRAAHIAPLACPSACPLTGHSRVENGARS
jgi:hypothetical protein